MEQATAGTAEESVVLAEVRKNAREVVRISKTTYHGIDLLSLRVFYQDGEELKPGKGGLALRLEKLDELRAALDHAAALVNPPVDLPDPRPAERQRHRTVAALEQGHDLVRGTGR